MAVMKEPWCIVIPIFFAALCTQGKKYEQEVLPYLFFDARLQEYKVILKEVGFLSPMVTLWWLCDFSTNVVVQLLNHVQLFATTWTAVHQASLSITVSLSLLKLISIESMMPSNHLILSPLSLPIFSLPQHQGVFHWDVLLFYYSVSASLFFSKLAHWDLLTWGIIFSTIFYWNVNQ